MDMPEHNFRIMELALRHRLQRIEWLRHFIKRREKDYGMREKDYGMGPDMELIYEAMMSEFGLILICSRNQSQAIMRETFW